MIETDVFFTVPDDVVLNILFKLEEDPRHWARLACVSTKFSSLIRNTCWRTKCFNAIPSIVADLLATSSLPPGGWSSLFKLSVCCPGLLHAGILLENSDFGLERELGPDQNFQLMNTEDDAADVANGNNMKLSNDVVGSSTTGCSWSMYDDLYNDTVYNSSENLQDGITDMIIEENPIASASASAAGARAGGVCENMDIETGVVKVGREFSDYKKRKVCRLLRSHLASGVWNLSREQGNKLLASRFRGDSLYICDWPGCVHAEEKRNYMLFRGIFKNFKNSRVWRTINDGNRSRIDLNCAFCSCKETWDLHSAFCLRRSFGFHDDGEPVVRAFVCENGHVSGAWTDLPLYT
ncbi:hypothetical protein ACFE04_017641 [Oxalis oulophora]